MQISQNQQKKVGLLFSLARLIDEKRADLGKAFGDCFLPSRLFGPFTFPLLATFLFYYPSIRNGSRDAGSPYGGDLIGFYWPYLSKLQYLLSWYDFVVFDFIHFSASAIIFPLRLLLVGWLLCSPLESNTIQVVGHNSHSGIYLTHFYNLYDLNRRVSEQRGFDEGNLLEKYMSAGRVGTSGCRRWIVEKAQPEKTAHVCERETKPNVEALIAGTKLLACCSDLGGYEGIAAMVSQKSGISSSQTNGGCWPLNDILQTRLAMP